MITERIGYTMEVLEDGQIQVRRVTHFERDGVEVSKEYHRHVLHPGQPLGDEDERVKSVAQVVHTPAVIMEWDRKESLRQAALD